QKDLRSVLYRDILLNALKAKRDELDILDLKVINRAMAEFRYAARVFKPYRGVRKVSIFGSAREKKGHPYYELAVRLGRLLVGKGFMVITGAAEGIMRAGIEGAGPENSFGVNILLPFEKGPAKVIQDDPKVINFRYFFTRKVFFVMEADAVALFPGGFGTHDEGFEVLTLLHRLGIRLERDLSDPQFSLLNERFRDLVTSGKISKTAALDAERDEPHLRSKPRLVFACRLGRAGRLNEMILAINEFGRPRP